MATPAHPQRIPHFAIVGSPRSGTTLVQRLCCELEGVVVPHETHFFSSFLPWCRPRFPLDGDRLVGAIRAYLALPTSRGLGISAEGLLARLRGRCDDAAALFAAVLGALTDPRGAAVVGEKTPLHLRHWREVLGVNPDLKLIAVVRDPRAVVASRLRVPWGTVDVRALAFGWRSDQATLRGASAELGASRFLWLRYEDVVDDLDAARARVAGFLGVAVAGAGVPPREALFHDWEHWKGRAVLAPEPARAAAWTAELDPRDAALVAAVARREMSGFGYDPGPRPGLADRLSLAAWHNRRRAVSVVKRALRAARAATARVSSRGG